MVFVADKLLGLGIHSIAVSWHGHHRRLPGRVPSCEKEKAGNSSSRGQPPSAAGAAGFQEAWGAGCMETCCCRQLPAGTPGVAGGGSSSSRPAPPYGFGNA